MPQVSIFVINLDESQDRLREITKKFENHSLSFERIPAVNGNQISAHDKKRFVKSRLDATKLTPGEIGCYQSHLSAFRIIVERNIPIALIVEDYIIISDDLSYWIDSESPIPVDADIVKLEGSERKVNPEAITIFKYRARSVVSPFIVSFRSAAYLITYNGAQKALASLVKMRRPIDHDLFDHCANALIIYEVRPFPIKQIGLDTTINRVRIKSNKRFSGFIFYRKKLMSTVRMYRAKLTLFNRFGFRAFRLTDKIVQTATSDSIKNTRIQEPDKVFRH